MRTYRHDHKQHEEGGNVTKTVGPSPVDGGAILRFSL